MIKNISIKNFKSIKDLEFKAKRINLFIGKPNTGKSNILEALGIFMFSFLSREFLSEKLKILVRLERAIDLFFNNQVHHEIEVKADNCIWKATASGNRVYIYGQKSREDIFRYTLDMSCNFLDGRIRYISSGAPFNFRFYRFKILDSFPRDSDNYLSPPDGENLLYILETNEKIYNLVNNLLEEYGWELVLERAESKIKVLNRNFPKPILLPYSSISDTFQRTIFYLTAIRSNKDAVIIFEEPEAHAFPYYTKTLAEAIALDDSGNQFFISTHNKYFLYSILEKAPETDVAIFVTFLENYQTKLKELNEQEKQMILEDVQDIFFNIEKFEK
jgi:AAA15 family ATPase/GTPase